MVIQRFSSFAFRRPCRLRPGRGPWSPERSASIVDKVLRGASPATIPVEQPTRFEVVVNAKAARFLGVTLPPAVVARADRVID